MGLYKQNGGKVWWMSLSFRGRQIRKSTGTANKKLAQAVLGKAQSQIVEGKYLEVSKTQDRTFAELMSRYLEEVTPGKKPNSQRDDRMFSKKWSQWLGKKYLDQITSDFINQYVQKRKETVGPCMINRELAFLSASFNKAIKVWGWCKDNPVTRIPREKEKKRVKYFSDHEFSEIYGYLVEWVRPIVLLAKNTGLRLSNLVNLCWEQINLKGQVICLNGEEMKNSQSLGVPLNDNSRQVLKEQHRIRKLHSPYVFFKQNGNPYTGWGVSKVFKKACISAGYPDYRFHDLRHDFCSKLVQGGVDLYTVKELAGHQDITTTQRYAHLSPGRLKEAVSVLDYHKSIIVEKKGLTK